MKVHRIVLASLVALSISAVAGQAADFCIVQTGGLGLTYVGKGFTIPPKGKCRSWLGFTTLSSTTFISTGTACTISSGANLHLGITTPLPIDGAGVVADDIVLPLPLGPSGTDGQQILNNSDGGADTFTLTTVVGAKCVPPVVPIP
jgi:hypothetical protein